MKFGNKLAPLLKSRAARREGFQAGGGLPNLDLSFLSLSGLSRFFQARKRNPNPNFLVRIFSGGVGVFHVKGWGPKVRYAPRNQGNQTFFLGRDILGFCRDIPEEPEKFEKKGLGSILIPYFWRIFPILGGIFPIRPGRFSRPLQSTYKEHSQKGPRHNQDLFPKSVTL